MMSAAAHVAKKYMFAIATVYMCYLTHGIQAIILSQNKVNFYTQWGYTDAAAGAAAVSIAITLTGVGKFVSVWLGGEISDRIGRKIPAVTGSILYVICFALLLITDNFYLACFAGFLSGVATSGFWDGALYPAIAEANPKYAGSSTIGIKAVISVSGIVYPLISAINSGETWHINIWIPIILSGICVVFAALHPLRMTTSEKKPQTRALELKMKLRQKFKLQKMPCCKSPLLLPTS